MSRDAAKVVVHHLYAFFGVLGLFVGLGDGCQAAGDAFAVGFELLFVAER